MIVAASITGTCAVMASLIMGVLNYHTARRTRSEVATPPSDPSLAQMVPEILEETYRHGDTLRQFGERLSRLESE